MADELTLDERIEAWRKRWNTKIGADLFNNRKEDLKALFRLKRWNKLHSERLEGRLLRVKEHHELNRVCPACHGGVHPHSIPGYFTDRKYMLGWYNEELDRLGTHQLNDVESPKFVMPGNIVMATGMYIERIAWEDYPGEPDRFVEILTEKAIGLLHYETYLQPIKRSEIEKRLSVK